MRAVTSTSLKHRQKQRHSVYVATTLYDVIEAVSAQVPSDENYLLTPAVLKLLQDCGAGSLFKGSAWHILNGHWQLSWFGPITRGILYDQFKDYRHLNFNCVCSRFYLPEYKSPATNILILVYFHVNVSHSSGGIFFGFYCRAIGFVSALPKKRLNRNR